MVSPARLVETLSQVTGFPLASVVDIDRKLVIARLRRKTGRGPHVAQMTALDAARLLTAMLGSPQSNAAADAVRRYQATRIDSERSSVGLLASTGLEDLAGLKADHSFVDGLEALIGSAARGSISALITDTQNATQPHIEIFAFTGVTRGRIRISGLSGGHTASLEFAPQPSTEHAEFSGWRRSGDLEQSRRITEQTICAVAALLRMEARHDGR